MRYFNTETKLFSYDQRPTGKHWLTVLLIENKPKDYPASFYAQVGNAVFDEDKVADVATYELIPLDILKQKLYMKNNDTCSACRGRTLSFKSVDVDISTEKKRTGIVNMKAKAKKFKANKNIDWLDLTAQDVLDLQDLLDDETQKHIDNEFNENKTVSELADHKALADYLIIKNGG